MLPKVFLQLGTLEIERLISYSEAVFGTLKASQKCINNLHPKKLYICDFHGYRGYRSAQRSGHLLYVQEVVTRPKILNRTILSN